MLECPFYIICWLTNGKIRFLFYWFNRLIVINRLIALTKIAIYGGKIVSYIDDTDYVNQLSFLHGPRLNCWFIMYNC